MYIKIISSTESLPPVKPKNKTRSLHDTLSVRNWQKNLPPRIQRARTFAAEHRPRMLFDSVLFFMRRSLARSFFDTPSTDHIRIRLRRGFHLTPEIIKEVRYNVLNLFRYPDSLDSPVRGVIACVLHKGTIAHYLSDNQSDSYIINKMNKVTFRDKDEAPVKDRKVVFFDTFKSMEKISIFNLLFSIRFVFYAKWNGWNHYIPIYMENADKSEVTGIIMLMIKDKGIFTNIVGQYGETLHRIVEDALKDHGQKHARSPEESLTQISLKKLGTIENLNRLNIATYIMAALTTVSFARFLISLDRPLARIGGSLREMYAFFTRSSASPQELRDTLTALHSMWQEIDLSWSGIEAVLMPILTMILALRMLKLMKEQSRNDITEKNEMIIREGTENMKAPEVFDLEKHMFISDTKFLVNEYVKQQLKLEYRHAVSAFAGYLKDNTEIEHDEPQEQLSYFKDHYQPLSGSHTILDNFQRFLGHELKGLTSKQVFERFARQNFLEKNASYLMKKLQEDGIAPAHFTPQDALTIAETLLFSTTITKGAFPKNDIKQIGYEYLSQALRLENLSRPITDVPDVFALCLGYDVPHSLNALRIKLRVLADKKYQKEKIILSQIAKELSRTTDKEEQSILNTMRNDIRNMIIPEGLFEARYYNNVTEGFGDHRGLFERIKSGLDHKTIEIQNAAKIILRTIDALFTDKNRSLFFALPENEQQHFFRIFILALEKIDLTDKHAEEKIMAKVTSFTVQLRNLSLKRHRKDRP